MADNPMPAITKLRAALADMAATLGLDLETLIIVPDDDPDGTHLAQAVFHLDPVKAFGIINQREIDRQFAAIAKGAEATDEADTVNDIRAQLTERLASLRPGDGLGLDD